MTSLKRGSANGFCSCGRCSRGCGGAKGGGKNKQLLRAIPPLLLAVLAGLCFSGALPGLPGLLGIGGKSVDEARPAAEDAAPMVVELPEMIANLNEPGRRPVFVKLKVRQELARANDQAAFAAAQPRVVDLVQTYLREMRPDELRGSAGAYCLREELIARASLAVAPATVTDVLFSELLVQ